VSVYISELDSIWRTNLGRARAWLRLALMQKRLADYFRTLIEHRPGDAEFLSEYYDPSAMLRSDEAALVVGLLVSLNVVDCNLCIKEEHLDSQQGVIDFSLYLRNKKDVGHDDDGAANGDVTDEASASSPNTNNSKECNNMTAVLDQKNYIEELNRHLK
jgi:hypothetical protein